MEIKQVKFKDTNFEGNNILGGIMVDNKFVICGCCGGVFEVEEVEILEVYKVWLNISDEIRGEE